MHYRCEHLLSGLLGLIERVQLFAPSADLDLLGHAEPVRFALVVMVHDLQAKVGAAVRERGANIGDVRIPLPADLAEHDIVRLVVLQPEVIVEPVGSEPGAAFVWLMRSRDRRGRRRRRRRFRAFHVHLPTDFRRYGQRNSAGRQLKLLRDLRLFQVRPFEIVPECARFI